MCVCAAQVSNPVVQKHGLNNLKELGEGLQQQFIITKAQQSERRGGVKQFSHKTIFSAIYSPCHSRDLNRLSHKPQQPIRRKVVRGRRCL